MPQPAEALSGAPVQADWTEHEYRGRGSFWLTLIVHFDAIRATPRAYLTALWWRLLGKRLRARSRLAPLLGQSPRAYDLWIRGPEASRSISENIEQAPPIIALIDTGADPARLDKTIRSLENANLKWHMVAGGSDPEFAEISRSIEWQAKPWLMPLTAGDTVAPTSLGAYRSAIAGSDAHLIYSDDDLLDRADQRIAPHFKPGWNSELFRHFDYLTGACIIRPSAEDVACLSGHQWMQQLTALAVDRGTPVHLPQVLHHRRSRPRPELPPMVEASGVTQPLVSVIIPTRNRVDLLRTCFDGLARTNYPNFEVLVVDNDSDDPATLSYMSELRQSGHRVLRHSGPFNYSAINNAAVAQAHGNVLCLLNNDVEVIDPNWLTSMVTQAMRADVGAVGAQLLYPDGRIQHAGVVLGICGGAAHAHRYLLPSDEGYFRRHLLPQFVSAVTAACLVVVRDRFLAVGGLDEKNFPVAFNDVDLCMRLNQQGWQSLYEPRARLIHHESVSRGEDREPANAARFAREMAALQSHWGTDRCLDPFHHPELSPLSERFIVRL